MYSDIINIINIRILYLIYVANIYIIMENSIYYRRNWPTYGHFFSEDVRSLFKERLVVIIAIYMCLFVLYYNHTHV